MYIYIYIHTHIYICIYILYTHTSSFLPTRGHTGVVPCMRWLQLVGSIKLQVSFAKETYRRDAILQKKPIILSILLTVATPYRLEDTQSLRKRCVFQVVRVLSKDVCPVNLCVSFLNDQKTHTSFKGHASFQGVCVLLRACVSFEGQCAH